MIFKLIADCEFEADNIIGALKKLGKHFKKMSKDKDEDLLLGGEITIKPL